MTDPTIHTRAETAANIAKYGVQWIVVQRSELPRWAYSIGLTERGGPEVVIAGAVALSLDELREVLEAFASSAESRLGKLPENLTIQGWSIRSAHPSWVEGLLLGANRYYERTVDAVQLVPPPERWTIDTPSLSAPWSPGTEPVWRWLADEEPWTFSFKREAIAFADVAVLQGRRPARTAGLWEEDEWEVFSYSDDERANIDPADVRPIPLATLIAAFPDLAPLGGMVVGDALIREGAGPWETWE